MTSHPELLALADWRRRIAELYAEVRRASATDPTTAHATWRSEREALFRGHPASPVPIGERGGFRAVHWPYANAWRRIQARRRFMGEALGITLHPDVLPFSNLAAFLPPFLLRPDRAMTLAS